jgi:diguanylate cyclase (GGDEF)-like protein
MRALYLILLLFTGILPVNADYAVLYPPITIQDQDIQDSEEIEKKIYSDFNVLEELLLNGKRDEALQLAEKNLSLARELNNEKLLAELLAGLGWHWEYEGNYAKALNYLYEAAELMKLNNMKLMLADVLNIIGNCEARLLNYQKSVEAYTDAMKIFRELEDVPGITFSLNNIAITFEQMGNEQKQLEYYNKALEFARENGFDHGQALALANIGAYYLENEELDRADELLREALLINQKTDRIDFNGFIYFKLAEVDKERGDFKRALEKAERALEIASQIQLGGDILKATILKADIKNRIGNSKEALELINQAMEQSRELGNKPLEIQALKIKSEILKSMGRFEDSVTALEKHIELYKDSDDEKAKRVVHEMQARFDLDQKENQIDLLNSRAEIKELQLQQKETVQAVLIAGLILALLGLSTIYYFFRSSTKARREIAEKNNALEDAYAKMEHLANSDTLTGLVNRRAFHDILNYEQNRQERTDMPMCLVIADIDRFKLINDNYGHDIGDQVLIWLAAIMRGKIRAQDTLCRWGGEEFLILMPDTTLEQGVHSAERIRETLQTVRFRQFGVELDVTLTFGVAQFNRDDDPRTIINQADQALYRGKHMGRNAVIPFTADLFSDKDQVALNG